MSRRDREITRSEISRTDVNLSDGDDVLSEIFPLIMPDDPSLLASSMTPSTVDSERWLDADELEALPLGSVALCYRITPLQPVPVQKVVESGRAGWVPAGFHGDEILTSDFIAPASLLISPAIRRGDLPPNSCT